MDATNEQIQGMIINYEKALREYRLSEKEKKKCLKEIKKLREMKGKL